MTNQSKIGLILIVCVIMGGLIWFLSGESPEEQAKAQKKQAYVSSNWNKEYQLAEKDPKGLYLFNKLLRAHIDRKQQMSFVSDARELETVIEDSSAQNTYVFVGNRFGLETSEFDTILKRVSQGSDVFLAYHEMTENLVSSMFDRYGHVFDYDEEINVFMGQKKMRMINLYQNDTVAKNWLAYDPACIAKDSMIELASFMELTALVELQHGDGRIYLSTTPELFQNYQIKRNPGFEFTSMVQDLLPKNQDVYMLEVGRLSDDYGTQDVDELDEGEGKEDNSYLRVIFENKTLLKAFLAAILGILIFLIFRSKRIRPVVPYLEPKKNTTRAFVETLTSIYFSKRNPYGMLSLQRRNFYNVIQKHFFIDLQRREGERELLALSEKSNIPLEEIKSLIAVLETKEAFDVSDQTIAQIHKRKQDFYKRTGIIADFIEERQASKELVVHRNLWTPGLLLMVGIAALFYGFYLLVDANGIGVLLWPIAAITLFLAIRQLRAPVVQLNEEEFIYTPSFGFKKSFKREDLIRVEWDNRSVQVVFKGKQTIIIHQREIGRFESAKFKRALQRFKTEEQW